MIRLWPLLFFAALLTGCTGGGHQDALNPIGPQSGHIKNLTMLLFWITVVVWTAITIALVGALLPRSPSSQARVKTVIFTCVGLTVITVLVVLVASAVTGRTLASAPEGELNINILGQQWWWDFEYTDGPPYARVHTPNEFHIPVGRPVRIHTSSIDVIHSFWAPNLQGKLDAIPDHWNTTWFQADKPGIYSGQCAEFCGLQHAQMRFLVIADPPDKFEQWLNLQRQPAAPPATDKQIQGLQIFLGSPCVTCHQIRGTDAHGSAGPDLTHLASRQIIAAGAVRNTPGNLAGWIVDSHRVKPGNNMPPMQLPSEEIEPLVTYLESLK